MKKYDKSLIEVQEWKESVYRDVKDLTAKEYIEKIRADAERVLSENSIKLAPVSSKREHQKI